MCRQIKRSLIKRCPSSFRVLTLFKNHNLKNFSDEKKKDEPKPVKKLSDSDDNKPAVNRLNELLASMSKKDSPDLKTTVDIKKIGVAGRKKKKILKEESSDSSDDEKPKNIVQAATKLAAKMSNKVEDQKQTEAELLSKLLSHSQEISEMSVNQKSSMNLK